jgi:LysR family transcriptional regulator, cyn operon transcriptional activator
MELRHIRYFIRVAELLHFTRAAESLHVSQPTLSTHIQQLEEEIGAPLFDRGRNLRLTEAGQLFLTAARKSYQELELVKEKIWDLRRTLRGTLTVGATYVFSQKLLPGVLAAYAAAYPEVQVSMQLGGSHEIEQGVLARAIDVGLACMPPDSKEIEYEELFSEELVLIVSKQHTFAAKTEMDLQELDGFPLSLPSAGFRVRRGIDEHFTKEKISPKVLMEINDFPALLTMVKTNNIATIGCRGYLTKDADVHLITLTDSGLPLKVSKGLIRSKDQPLSAAVCAFIELTKSELSDLSESTSNYLSFEAATKVKSIKLRNRR